MTRADVLSLAIQCFGKTATVEWQTYRADERRADLTCSWGQPDADGNAPYGSVLASDVLPTEAGTQRAYSEAARKLRAVLAARVAA
jgi:hypothetical protein